MGNHSVILVEPVLLVFSAFKECEGSKSSATDNKECKDDDIREGDDYQSEHPYPSGLHCYTSDNENYAHDEEPGVCLLRVLFLCHVFFPLWSGGEILYLVALMFIVYDMVQTCVKLILQFL